jgi:hypothetical protein
LNVQALGKVKIHMRANVLRTAEGLCFGNGCFNDNEYTKRTKCLNLPKCTNLRLCAVTSWRFYAFIGFQLNRVFKGPKSSLYISGINIDLLFSTIYLKTHTFSSFRYFSTARSVKTIFIPM